MANNNSIKMDIAFHPGETLKDKISEMNLTNAQFAELALLPESVIEDIVNGNASVTSDIAIAFEQTTKIPAKMWIRAQHRYDDYILESKKATYLQRLSQFSKRAAAVLL